MAMASTLRTAGFRAGAEACGTDWGSGEGAKDASAHLVRKAGKVSRCARWQVRFQAGHGLLVRSS